ncbi:MAG: co-chaperone DjlA [Legionella sp.]
MNFRQYFTNNCWWGKLIGAVLGHLIAGPAGALIGILIGNFFDQGLMGYLSRPHWYYHMEKQEAVQSLFIRATFTALGYVAKSDGRVSEQDIKMANAIMHEMGLDNTQRQAAREAFKIGKHSEENLFYLLSQLKTLSSNKSELIKLFINIQYRAAQIDGLSQGKLQAMNRILKKLGFAPLQEQYRFYDDFMHHFSANHFHDRTSSSSQQSNRRQTYQQPTENTLVAAYAILEVSPNSSYNDVKKAYRRLMSINHPDKLIAQGKPPHLIKIANEKTQRIRKAYDEICNYKGW